MCQALNLLEQPLLIIFLIAHGLQTDELLIQSTIPLFIAAGAAGTGGVLHLPLRCSVACATGWTVTMRLALSVFLHGTLNIVPALTSIAGGLLAAGFGWRAPFLALAAYSLLVGILTTIGLAETRPAGTRASTKLPFVRYWQIATQGRFILFALVNTGAMAMALTYVSFLSQVPMGEGGLTPLDFSMVFGANGFWIMLASVIANRVIRKMERPVCLTFGTVLMALGSLMLLFNVTAAPANWQTHWLSYMLPVATACAGLAFLMGPATKLCAGAVRRGGGRGVSAEWFCADGRRGRGQPVDNGVAAGVTPGAGAGDAIGGGICFRGPAARAPQRAMIYSVVPVTFARHREATEWISEAGPSPAAPTRS